MSENLAEYKCLACGFTWADTMRVVDCLNCGGVYIKWVNFEEWKSKAGSEYRRIIDGHYESSEQEGRTET